ncbi:MAG TPA: hypothetical protein PK680_06115 [Novosphingobium sp.]|nr:hypothetical protein [Novosphingobium sp.]
MLSLKKILRALAMLMGMAAAGMATGAQAQSCGVTGHATATPVVYDPFNPSAFGTSGTANITMTLKRINTSGGGDTRYVNLYLRASPQVGTRADGTSIKAISSSTGGTTSGYGLNIFYNYNTPGPINLLPANSGPAGSDRFFHIDFTGNNTGSDTATVNFEVTLPNNLDVDAVQNLAFDAYFSCLVRGGDDNNVQQTGSFGNAVVFPITVLSALRTYYAGTALDFGDITNIPAVPPSAVRTDPGNHLVVQSSGAYSVTLSSQNAFKLKKPGATTTNDEVRYSLKFLGDTVSNSTHPSAGQTAISHTCIRAGLASIGQQLPIQATLIDGGDGKNPSPSYADILTVTVTPLIYNTVTTDNCGSYSVP